MSHLDTRRYTQSIVELVEELTMTELTDQGRKLICNYLEENAGLGMAECARASIHKYCSKPIPSLDDIRQRNAAGQALSNIDHLVLQMEYEARQLEKRL